uniref:Uncharacterized protein n=1 Tax=Arundo donax TaxID=35708 RepID=A0A0A9CJT5_ARUDO
MSNFYRYCNSGSISVLLFSAAEPQMCLRYPGLVIETAVTSRLRFGPKAYIISRQILPVLHSHRPNLSMSFCSISSLFTNNVYLVRSSVSPSHSPKGTASFMLSDVLSNLPEYTHENGTNSPCRSQSHPWAALRAAPKEAESDLWEV